MSSEAEKACPQLEVRTKAADGVEVAVRRMASRQALARAMGMQEDVGRAMAGHAVALGWCSDEAAQRELARHGK